MPTMKTVEVYLTLKKWRIMFKNVDELFLFLLYIIHMRIHAAQEL